ncbi:MAG TPA: hypothetical protein VM536_10185 [Chloroflexia bacterium]|nr:hypothetical protein [Chloroflexia bacterium]
MADVFECPSCSAPLKPDGPATTVKCPYCDESVVVPPGLRTPPPSADAFGAPTVVVQLPSYHPPPQPAAQATVSRGTARGCLLFVVLIVLLTVGLPLYFTYQTVSVSVAPLMAAITQIPMSFPTRVPTETPAPPIATAVLTIDGKATGPSSFADPRALARDAAGNIYVTASKPGRVVKFDAQGRYLAGWPLGEDYPDDLQAAPNGTLYSVVSGAIRRYDGASGQLQDTMTWKDSDFGFFGIQKLAVLPDGSLLATLGHSDNLVRLDAHGAEIRRYSHPLKALTGGAATDLLPAADAQGNIYLLGADTETLYKLGADGKLSGVLGSKGKDPGQFDNVRSVALDAAGRIYVSDSYGIQVFDRGGGFVGRIKTPSFVYAMAGGGDGQVLALAGDQVIEYRLNAQLLKPPVAADLPTPSGPTATPLPSVGSTVTHAGWVISLARAESRPTLQVRNPKATIKPDSRFLLLWVDARNQQSSPHSLSTDFRWYLRDENDRTYSAVSTSDLDIWGAVLRQESRDALDRTVAPQGLTHPWLAFDVPATAPGLELTVSSAVGGSTVTFAVPELPAP